MVNTVSSRKKAILFFLVKFFAIYFAFQFVILNLDFSFLENFLASFEAQALDLPFSGNLVFVGSHAFAINANCTGLVSVILLGAIVFSLQKPALPKKIGLWIVGSIVLLLLNVLRLFFVLWIGKGFGVSAAETSHVVSWFLTILFILVVWIVLAKKIAKVKQLPELLE